MRSCITMIVTSLILRGLYTFLEDSLRTADAAADRVDGHDAVARAEDGHAKLMGVTARDTPTTSSAWEYRRDISRLRDVIAADELRIVDNSTIIRRRSRVASSRRLLLHY